MAKINNESSIFATFSSNAEPFSLPRETNLKPNNVFDKSHLACSFDESPLYILKVAALGDVDEFERLVQKNFKLLKLQDYRGQNVVHHAVAWSRLKILQALEKFQGQVDLNGQDKLGQTPLHLSIEKNQFEAFRWLLAKSVDLNRKNKQNHTPLHHAVDLCRLEMVRKILEKCPWTVNLPGDAGKTPLHIACSKNSPEIAKVLLEEGADLVKEDLHGFQPIHVATRNGSASVLDVLLEFAELRGLTSKALVHMPDGDLNLPLHSATNSGDLKAVQVCLRAGADIDVQQVVDKQTPIHYAAAKGGAEMIRLMFEAQPEKVEGCLQSRDILEQTPLHKAAMLNHLEVVEQLVEAGSSLNAQDGERRTPLMLAASKNAVLAVNYLLKRRANTSIRDKENRNFLHILIQSGSNLANIDFTPIKNLKVLLNEKDDSGFSPLMYASKTGQCSALRDLIKLGASLTLKDNDKKNSLHLAAKFGRLQTCRNLLSSEQGSMLINELDSQGRNPLHIAAQFGHFKVLAFLIRKGSLLSRDYQQNTALHLASENGHYEAATLLLGNFPHLINCVNIQGNTALHLAALNGHALLVDFLMSSEASFETNKAGATFFDLAIVKVQADVCSIIISHCRSEEAMMLPSCFETPFIGLVQNLPKIALLVMDQNIKFSQENKKSQNYHITYDFRYVQTPKLEPNSKQDFSTALLPLNMMVKYNRVDLLTHPLCVTLLKTKWKDFGALIYNFRVGIYMLFLALLTSVVFDSTSCLKSSKTGKLYFEPPKMDLSIRMIVCLAFSAINCSLHVWLLVRQRLRYLLNSSNYLEWALHLTTICGMLPYLLADGATVELQKACLQLSLLFGWVLLLLYMRSYEWFGIYIIMFTEIIKTLLRAIIVFSFVVIAFGLAFSMTFRTTNGPTIEFKTIPFAFLSTLSMILGGFNYFNLIMPTLKEDKQLIYGDLTYVFFMVFVIVFSRLLTNMLVGLSVGDIGKVRKTAHIKRIAMQIDFFSNLDGKIWQKIGNQGNASLLYKFYPNKPAYTIWQCLTKFRTWRHDNNNNETLQELDEKRDEEKSNDMSQLLEQLTFQTRRLANLSGKVEQQQQRVKQTLQKLFVDDDGDDDCAFGDDVDDGVDDDNNNNNIDDENMGNYVVRNNRMASTEFQSAASMTQRQAMAVRFASSAVMVRKPKIEQIWNSEDGDAVHFPRRRQHFNK